jgi:hypothetical protein
MTMDVLVDLLGAPQKRKQKDGNDKDVVCDGERKQFVRHLWVMSILK